VLFRLKHQISQINRLSFPSVCVFLLCNECEVFILEVASNFIWTLPVPNPNEPNSSLTYYLHIGRRNEARLRVVSSLLAQILSEPTFNILRTKEQLGYVVSASPWVLPGESQFGLRFIVQSERHPLYLEERVEIFLETMRLKLSEMDEGELKEQKNGLQRKWKEAVKNLAEETNRYWEHIESGFLDFYRRAFVLLFSWLSDH
jgi:insulysin